MLRRHPATLMESRPVPGLSHALGPPRPDLRVWGHHHQFPTCKEVIN